ncbi:hypothetical protein [Kordia zhangzhouensis]|uniref:hypothetical protein n=1 Tax=Kordia zhangzhouensis TaxID=1620405 RepID=UPI0012FB42FC|nr:hypothetical protein [Kordia zhangzhouensis]
MKKRSLHALQLNKRSISSLKNIVKGGLRTPLDSDCSSFGNGECEETYCNCQKN